MNEQKGEKRKKKGSSRRKEKATNVFFHPMEKKYGPSVHAQRRGG